MRDRAPAARDFGRRRARPRGTGRWDPTSLCAPGLWRPRPSPRAFGTDLCAAVRRARGGRGCRHPRRHDGHGLVAGWISRGNSSRESRVATRSRDRPGDRLPRAPAARTARPRLTSGRRAHDGPAATAGRAAEPAHRHTGGDRRGGARQLLGVAHARPRRREGGRHGDGAAQAPVASRRRRGRGPPLPRAALDANCADRDPWASARRGGRAA